MNKKYQVHNQLTGLLETAETFDDAKALQARIKADFRAAQYPTPGINYKTTVDSKVSYFILVDNAPPSNLLDEQYNVDWLFEGYIDDTTKPSSYIYHNVNDGIKEFDTYAEVLADANATTDYIINVEKAELFVISVLVHDESDGLWFQSRSDDAGEPTASRYANISLG